MSEKQEKGTIAQTAEQRWTEYGENRRANDDIS